MGDDVERISIPGVRLVSVANTREHWRKRHTRKTNDVAACRLLAGVRVRKWKDRLPVAVTIRRIGVQLLDDDNLQLACKHIRDWIANELLEHTQANQHGTRGDDSDDRIKWRYEQGKGDYGLVIEIREQPRDRWLRKLNELRAAAVPLTDSNLDLFALRLAVEEIVDLEDKLAAMEDA